LSFPSTATAHPALYTLSLHDALPICGAVQGFGARTPHQAELRHRAILEDLEDHGHAPFLAQPRRFGNHGVPVTPNGVDDSCEVGDRKSTRLNSSHVSISYAVFCLKKK